MKLIDKHQSNQDYHPEDWVHTFSLETLEKGDNKGCIITKCYKYTTQRLTLILLGM